MKRNVVIEMMKSFIFWRIWTALELELDYTTIKNSFKYIAFRAGAVGTDAIYVMFFDKIDWNMRNIY